MKKRIISVIVTMLCVSTPILYAQNFTKSYGAVSCQGPTGLTSVPAGMSTYVDFYDDYIYVMGNGKFRYSKTNYDGSVVYQATTQITPAMCPVAVVMAKDYSAMNLVVNSTIIGMGTIQMVYNYQWIGDGSRAAKNMMESTPPTNSYEGITCHSCRGNGACKYCHGSGRNQYTRDGRCGVCRGTGRCAGCDGKGSY